ncbi:MAG: AgmX/PglI C-terminal domain-containing protein [Kofleriaceae bacterium]
MMRWVLVVVGLGACGSSNPPVAKPGVGTSRSLPVSDEEPEDGVELRHERGRFETATIEAAIEPHKNAWVDCFRSRVGKRRWLGGKVAIRWDVEESGEVAAVKLFESDLGACPIEKCVLEVARLATFGKPIGGDTDFMIPLEFPPQGRPELWDDDQALRAVGGQLAQLDECVKPESRPATKAANKKGRQPKRPPPRKAPPSPPIVAPDEVMITVYVGPRGEAQSVGFASTKSLIDDAWATCAETIALAWRLPDPKGSMAKLVVRYR